VETQIEQLFKKELLELLTKYNAELEVSNHGNEYRENICMTVDIPGIYNQNGDTIQPYITINLGNIVTPTSKL